MTFYSYWLSSCGFTPLLAGSRDCCVEEKNA